MFLFKGLIERICYEIRKAVWTQLSEECQGATGCEPLVAEETKALPAPSKRK